MKTSFWRLAQDARNAWEAANLDLGAKGYSEVLWGEMATSCLLKDIQKSASHGAWEQVEKGIPNRGKDRAEAPLERKCMVSLGTWEVLSAAFLGLRSRQKKAGERDKNQILKSPVGQTEKIKLYLETNRTQLLGFIAGSF